MLLAAESGLNGNLDGSIAALLRVLEKLRGHLAKIIGPNGYHAFLSRALVLAKRQAPDIQGLEVAPDGTLQIQNGISNHVSKESAVMLIAQILRLLFNLVGPSITQRLIREACPDLALRNSDW